MKTPLVAWTTVALLGAAPPMAQALDVQDLSLSGFSFQVVTFGGAASDLVTETSPGAVIAPTAGADLAGLSHSGGPILSFFLADPLGRGSGTASLFLNAVAAPAQIDTTDNSLTLDLSSFSFTWETGAAPSLCTIKPCVQPQALGPVDGGAGSWNPATHQFTLSWTYVWAGDTVGDNHPYPLGTSTWTLSGVAQPVPEPAPAALLLAGLGVVGLLARRRQRAQPGR
jgi:hypothetical protein